MINPDGTTEKGQLLCKFLYERTQAGDYTNEDLVQFIEWAGMFLNLKTIPNYKEDTGMSYNGVKNHRVVREFFKTKYVIDND